jgi:large subunit ribosomal protein L4
MAVLNVVSVNMDKVGQMKLPSEIFEVPVKSNVLHEVVTMQLASKRSGTASVKHRSDVKGSGKKLFRQKGTGRARRGDVKDPLLKGGGSVFGPDPKCYAYRVPKKVRKLGLKMALSSKLNAKKLIVVDDFQLERAKTRDFMAILDKFNITNVLIVVDKANENLELSSRNVSKVKVLRSEGLNVYDILKFDHLILLASSIEAIERRLSA